MKNGKRWSSLLITLLVMGVAPQSHRASTEGTINFTKSLDKQGNLIKPETIDKEIVATGGDQSSGDLRIQHVPDFQFGQQEIVVGQNYYTPLLEEYSFTQPESGESGPKYLPHFIQVTDLRGEKKGWQLLVSATPFKTAEADMLAYTTITLKAARLSNDVYDPTEIANKVETFRENDNIGNVLVIPTDLNQGSVSVMQTRENSAEFSTDGSRTSIVLSSSYDKDKLTYLPTDKNPQVVLTKPAKDVPVIAVNNQQLKEYTSIITWTLLNGK